MDRRIKIPKKQNQGVGRGGNEQRIKVQNDNDQDVDVTLYDEDPPDVRHPQGKRITWLAYFKVHGQVSYTVQVSGLTNFVFWDGGQLEVDQNWTTRELTGDPAIGMI